MKLESSKRRWPWQKGRQQGSSELRLAGRQVVLRPKRLDDAEADYAWRTDPELAALDATGPLSISFREYLKHHKDELDYPSPWSVRLAVDTPEGRHIGNCMFYDIDAERKQTEIGIMIGDRAYWDRGFGTDTVGTLLAHIFRDTPIERVYLHTLLQNARAQIAFTKAGLKATGRVRRDGYEFLKMEVTRDQWMSEHPERAGGDETVNGREPAGP